jgi:hypothetical protein
VTSHRQFPGRNLAALGLATVCALGVGGIVATQAAAAPTLTVTACVQAKGALDLAVKAVLTLNPNVFPGGTVPVVSAVDPALLNQVLADPDLGEGGRGLVGAALAAFRAVADACDDPTATPTPTATPEPTTVAPTTIVVPGPTVIVRVPRVRQVQTG